MSLFRGDSERARADAWLGRILLVRPVSFMLLTVASLGVAFGLATYFFLGEYTRKARVTGIISPVAGLVRLLAPQSGAVEQVSAREGDAIVKGTALLRLVDGRAGQHAEGIGASVTARVAERRLALERQRAFALSASHTESSAIGERRSGIAREIVLLDAEIENQSSRVRLAHAGLERASRLQSIGFLSAAGLDRERDASLEQDSRLEAIRRTRLALARELSALAFESDATRSRAHAQLAALDMQRATLDQEGLERDLQYRAEIVAPTSGTVATVLVESGQMVTAGMPLATILPADARLEAHLFAPSRSIGFVRPGQQVLLRYLAYPHQKFGSHRARVVAVSRNPMTPQELGFTPIDGSREPVYRIKVALEAQSITAYGKQESLQAGMQVEADIQLDRRRLIEWVFEPLLSLAGRA